MRDISLNRTALAAGATARAGANVLRVPALGLALWLIWSASPDVALWRAGLFALALMLLFVAIPARHGMPAALWGWWLVYVVGFGVYVTARIYADEFRPVDYHTPIRFGTWLLGEPAPLLLQRHLWQPPGHDPLTLAFVGVYLSFFCIPIVLGALLCRRGPALIAVRYLVMLLLIMAGGLVGYTLVPTAPPWMASRDDLLPGVVRILPALFDPDGYDRAMQVVGANDVAAMPSLHLAMAAAVALGLAAWKRRVALLCLAYVLAMGFALSYLGEHYLLDELAGGALAVGTWWLAGRITAWTRIMTGSASPCPYPASARSASPSRSRPDSA